MSKRPLISETERADLVAYLDGELAGVEAIRLEARLGREPALRAEAAALKRTWDLLDHLPRPVPAPNFTHRTLDRLSTQLTRAALGRTRRPWLRRLGWAAAVLVAAAAGYFGAVSLVSPRPTEQDLVRDLRLIENLRYYEQAESLDFLRELDRPELFGDDPVDS